MLSWPRGRSAAVSSPAADSEGVSLGPPTMSPCLRRTQSHVFGAAHTSEKLFDEPTPGGVGWITKTQRGAFFLRRQRDTWAKNAEPICTFVTRGRNSLWVPSKGLVSRGMRPSQAIEATRRFAGRIRARFALLELRVVPSETQRLLLLTIAIGVVCGLAAVAFHKAIRIAEEGFASLIRFARLGGSHTWIFWTLLLPTVGGMVAGILLHRFPEARGSGIPQVKASYARKAGRVRLRDSFAKFALATFQIGSGASLGREGPTVQICAGIASSLGRLARVSPEAQRRLIPVGAAAGVAAAFNAPIAAVTFTIEEIIGKLDDTLLSGVIIAAALAAVIERSILGEHPVFDVHVHHDVEDVRSLLLYAMLGVAAAIVSIVFSDILLGLRKRFKRASRLPGWAKPAVGGLVTGIIAVATISLVNTPGINGGGYETLRRALGGDLRVKVMLVLCVAKLLATTFSYSSGGAGGIFAPVLFIGAMLGGSFGWVDVFLFNHPDRNTAAFALVGMGALFSGAIRAPMTSVLIIVEMTSGYELILPLMIANMSAYIIARRFRPSTIYEALLEQDGIIVDDTAIPSTKHEPLVERFTAPPGTNVTFEPFTPAGALVRTFQETRRQTMFPVIGDAGRLVGIITSREIQAIHTEPSLLSTATASDLMRAAVSVTLADTCRAALEMMNREGVRELAVVDSENRLVGYLDEGLIARRNLD